MHLQNAPTLTTAQHVHKQTTHLRVVVRNQLLVFLNDIVALRHHLLLHLTKTLLSLYRQWLGKNLISVNENTRCNC